MRLIRLFITFIVALDMILLVPGSVHAQSSAPVTGSGEACASSSVGSWCTGFTLGFHPAGGPVATTVNFSTSMSTMGGSITSDIVFNFTGMFQGGDGGEVSGTFTAVTTMSGFASGTCNHAGTWSGSLYSSGTGQGVFASNSGSCTTGIALSYAGAWNITYSASDFQQYSITQTPTMTASRTPTITPEQQPTQTPTVTMDPTMQAILKTFFTQFSGVKGSIFQQVKEINNQEDITRPVPPLLLPWLQGYLVALRSNPEGQAVVQDMYGNQVPINENGEPLEPYDQLQSPSQAIIAEHPDLDWPTLLDDMLRKTQDFLSLSLSNEVDILDTIEGATNPEISQAYVDLRAALSDGYLNLENQFFKGTGLTIGEIRTLERETLIQTLQDPIGQFAGFLTNPAWLLNSEVNYTNSYEEKRTEEILKTLQAIRSDISGIKPELIEKIDKLLADKDPILEEENGFENFNLIANLYISQQYEYDRISQQRSATAQVRKEIGVAGILELVERGVIDQKAGDYYLDVIRDKTLNLDFQSSLDAQRLIETFHSLEPIQDTNMMQDNTSYYSNFLSGLNRLQFGATEVNIQLNAMESGDAQ